MSYVTYQFETNIATYDTELEAEVIEQIEAEKNYVKVYETTDRQGQLIHRLIITTTFQAENSSLRRCLRTL